MNRVSDSGLRIGKKISLRSKKPVGNRQYLKEKRQRRFRIIAASLTSLVLAAVGSGTLYTWYVGNKTNPTAFATTPELKQRPTIKRPQISPVAKVGVALQSISTPVKPGENVTVTIRTNPAAKCTIVVEYNKIASKDTGLIPKIADDFGMISWGWTVEANRPVGKWPVTMTCANKKNSGVVTADLILK